MNFEKHNNDALAFFRKVAAEMGEQENTEKAYRITRTVFHTIREMITPEESLHLIAQLPMYLKAVYVDGWKPVHTRMKTMEEFLSCVRSKSDRASDEDFGGDDTAVRNVKIVLKVLKQYLTPDETEDILSQFPEALLSLWATRMDKTVG